MQLAKIVDGSLELVAETLNEVRRFPRNVRWIAGFGVGRSGKSFLMNFLSEGLNFKSSGTTEPCTSGVWISNPVRLPEGEDHFVVVDSEGTEMGDTSHLHKILALVCLITCDGGVLIQNEVHFGNGFLDSLALLASARVVVRGVESTNWPYLCVIFRNFRLKPMIGGQPCTNEEFLNSLLAAKNDSADNNRAMIKQSFVRRMLHVAPAPGDAELADPLNIPPGPFKTALDELRTSVLRAATAKTIAGVPSEGSLLAEFLQTCVQKINAEGDIGMASAVELTFDNICSRYADEAFAGYKNGMADFAENMTGDEAQLQAKHLVASANATASYTARTQHLFQTSARRFYATLAQRVENEYLLLQARNQRVHEEKARAEAERLLLEANARRIEEERRRLQAEEQARVAAQQRIAEERARRDAEEQQRRAEQAHREAAERQRVAEEQMRAAEQARVELERRNQEAEAARKRAEEERRRVEEAHRRAIEEERRRSETYFSLNKGFKLNGKRIW